MDLYPIASAAGTSSPRTYVAIRLPQYRRGAPYLVKMGLRCLGVIDYTKPTFENAKYLESISEYLTAGQKPSTAPNTINCMAYMQKWSSKKSP